MNNKGLCTTCIYDKTCIFSRKFPVIHCEEFSDNGLPVRNRQVKLLHRGKRIKVHSTLQEETIAE